MKRKNIRTNSLFLCISILPAVLMNGCATDFSISNGEAFSNGYTSCLPDAYCYSSYTDHDLKLLDFASMKTSSLCNQPNCTHKDPACIVQRLDRKAPLISDGFAYYFSDSAAELYENEKGKSDIKLRSALCCWDLRKGKEKKLLNVDGYSIAPYYGWLLHDGIFYYVGNGLSRHYDENHNLLYYGNSGGEMSLCFANPAASETAGLYSLYDIDAVAEYYPEAPNSAEAYMRGLFDNKIYFNIGFLERGDQWDGGFSYRFYVTYYDLTDGTYHGTPEDYGNIDFAAVSYLSDAYLVICREGEATVYEKGAAQPVILEDPCFYPDMTLSAFDGTVFCSGKVFELNTKAVYESKELKADSPDMNAKNVIARYGNDFIVCDDALNFEKIPAEQPHN